MPFIVVDGNQPKKTVNFFYYDQSDGVNLPGNNPYPFYPIPDAAITQAHWVEGGEPGNVDQRDTEDRHMLIVDRDNRTLYELYNVWYDSALQQWQAGSGGLPINDDGRPDTDSADAAASRSCRGCFATRRSTARARSATPCASRCGPPTATSIRRATWPGRPAALSRWARACA